MRIRKLSLSRRTAAFGTKTPPELPSLSRAQRELTEEIEDEEFEHVDDSGLGMGRVRAVFPALLQGGRAASRRRSASWISRMWRSTTSACLPAEKNGTIWTTWNYPFSYSLKLAPQSRVKRLRGDLSFLQLIEAHRIFPAGKRRRPGPARDPEAPETIQEEIQKRSAGANRPQRRGTGVITVDPKGSVRYSWRGLIYLWIQIPAGLGEAFLRGEPGLRWVWRDSSSSSSSEPNRTVGEKWSE